MTTLTENFPQHFKLQWHLLDHCNLRCTHCYQEHRSALADGLQLSSALEIFDQFMELVDFLQHGRPAGAMRTHLTLTGGEPFLWPDLFPLLEHIRSRNISFSLLTNGTLMQEGKVKELRALGPRYVQVSIEGSKSTHDTIRGNGRYAQAVQGISHLVRQRINTVISFTAQRNNYREFPSVAALGRKLKVNRVWADRLIPLGQGASEQEQVLSTAETLEFLEIMQRARKQHENSKTEISMHRALQFLLTGDRPYRCSAGSSLLALLPNGDLLPCRRMPRVVGNLFQESLLSLYLQSPLLLSLRNAHQLSSGCEKCFFASACGGGLRCLSDALYGSPFRADPGCWLPSLLNDSEVTCSEMEIIEQ